MSDKSFDKLREEVRNKYRNKQSLTKDEFSYAICDFNPDSDGPATLESYLKHYGSYITDIQN